MNPERARLLRDQERGLHRPHPLAVVHQDHCQLLHGLHVVGLVPLAREGHELVDQLLGRA